MWLPGNLNYRRAAIVAYMISLFDNADLDLEDNGAIYSKSGGKVISPRSLYSEKPSIK